MVWIGIGLTLVTGWLALQGVDLAALPGLLTSARPLPLLAAAALLPLAVWVKALQWQRLGALSGPTSFGGLLTATGVGLAVNNLAPARLGDVVRLLLGAQLGGLGAVRAASSILVEKLLDLLTLAALGLTIVPFAPLPWEIKVAVLATGLAAGMGLVGLAAVASRQQVLAGAFTARFPLPVGLAARLEKALESIGGLEHPRRLAIPAALSLLAWAVNAATFSLVLLAFDLRLPPAATVALVVVTNLGMALPSSPGYVGVFDYLCVVTLAPFGVEPTAALAFALAVHAYGLVLPSLLAVALVCREPLLRPRLFGRRRAALLPARSR